MKGEAKSCCLTTDHMFIIFRSCTVISFVWTSFKWNIIAKLLHVNPFNTVMWTGFLRFYKHKTIFCVVFLKNYKTMKKWKPAVKYEWTACRIKVHVCCIWPHMLHSCFPHLIDRIYCLLLKMKIWLTYPFHIMLP